MEKKRVRRKTNANKETGIKVKIGLYNLKIPAGAHKRRKLLGRGPGSGHGKTSTRGSKGQTSRSGKSLYLGYEGGQSPLIRKFPKRGFTSRFKTIYQVINIDVLGKMKGVSLINPELLREKGLIKGETTRVKILGEGEISSPITVYAHAFSKKAADKIKNAGGKTEIVSEDIS